MREKITPSTLSWLGLVVLASVVGLWVHGATARLAGFQTPATAGVAQASASDQGYCTGALKQILRRVLTSCGLVKGGGARGCQPLEARQVAAMSGHDFNALFSPLAERAAILEFDQDASETDPDALALLDKTFAEQRGASYFLVVARASPEGSASYNRDLSRQRAESVLTHLRSRFADPDLDQEVGLLWLGEEFAQLDEEFCRWSRSRPNGVCTPSHLNRSAFIAWIDCRL